MSINPPRPSTNGSLIPPTGNVPSGGGGQGPGGNPTVDLSQVSSTGGLAGTEGAVLVFGESDLMSAPMAWIFDPTDFNCEDDCEYHFKVEEIKPYTQPTINSVIIRYRDLGQVIVNAYFVGNVLQDSVVSKMVTVIFGGNNDSKIYTVKFDLTCTFEAPQLIITRNALMGPLSITKVLVEGESGDVTQP